MNPYTHSRSPQINTIFDPLRGRHYPIPAGGSDDDGTPDLGELELQVPEGYKVVSEAAFANLQNTANRKDNAAEENAALKRKLAFLEAGIDVKKGPGKLFLEHYTGEPTEEAIREAATAFEEEFEVKVIGAPAAPAAEEEGPPLEQGEAQQTAERQGLATGAAPAEGAATEDPYAAAARVMDERLKAGARTSDAQESYIDEIFGAASRGDERVLVKTEPPATTTP